MSKTFLLHQFEPLQHKFHIEIFHNGILLHYFFIRVGLCNIFIYQFRCKFSNNIIVSFVFTNALDIN